MVSLLLLFAALALIILGAPGVVRRLGRLYRRAVGFSGFSPGEAERLAGEAAAFFEMGGGSYGDFKKKVRGGDALLYEDTRALHAAGRLTGGDLQRTWG